MTTTTSELPENSEILDLLNFRIIDNLKKIRETLIKNGFSQEHVRIIGHYLKQGKIDIKCDTKKSEDEDLIEITCYSKKNKIIVPFDRSNYNNCVLYLFYIILYQFSNVTVGNLEEVWQTPKNTSEDPMLKDLLECIRLLEMQLGEKK